MCYTNLKEELLRSVTFLSVGDNRDQNVSDYSVRFRPGTKAYRRSPIFFALGQGLTRTVDLHSSSGQECIYACAAVTCHLHFCQNDRGLLRVTAVTWPGWYGHRIRVSWEKKFTHAEENSPRRFCRGSNSRPFRSRVRRSTNRAIPTPKTRQTTLSKGLL